jgi:hypothetical protein
MIKMEINGNNLDIDKLLENTNLEDNMLKDYGNNILLTDKYIEVLNRYDIDYKKFTSMGMLIYEIEECLNSSYGSDTDDLEWVATEISERNYYRNINK